MTYSLMARGAWPLLQQFFDTIPDRSVVTWVTYSLTISEGGKAKDALDYLCRRHFRVRILCAHPGRGFPALRRATVQAILDCRNDGHSVELRGFPGSAEPELEDGDDLNDDVLHAKVVLVSTNDGRHIAVHGSFNFADGSLGRNTEQVSSAEPANESMRQELNELWARAAPLGLEDCTDGETLVRPSGATVAPLIDSPATMAGSGNARAYEDEPPVFVSAGAPEVVQKAIAALDRMLQDYPGHGSPLRGFQYEQFARLQRDIHRRPRNLLYLPVGTGKSFIAVRWLLQGLADRSEARAVFLVPNEWMQQTILADLALVAARAGVTAEALHELVRVVRPAQVTAIRRLAIARIIADECHNWAPRGSKAQNASSSYTAAFEWLVQNAPAAPVVGLSATPCRMEAQRFSVQAFVRTFVDDNGVDHAEFWGMALSRAIECGILVEPVYRPIAQWAQSAINSILHDERGVPIRMGDYAATVLRDVWHELDRRRGQLVDEIVNSIRQERRSRVVIYLPPVAEDGEAFVNALRRKLRDFDDFGFWDGRARGADNRRTVLHEFRSFSATPARPAVLLGIDRFCEGVSVPSIDMLVMLRATLSPRVAMQALGRGLRLSEGKANCMVLDAVQFRHRLSEWERPDETGETAFSFEPPAQTAPSRSSSLRDVQELLWWLTVEELKRVLYDASVDYRSNDLKLALVLGVVQALKDGKAKGENVTRWLKVDTLDAMLDEIGLSADALRNDKRAAVADWIDNTVSRR